MKTNTALIASLMLTAGAACGGPVTSAKQPAPTLAQDALCHCARPDGVAPIGIMGVGDHLHPAGQFMVGYRYMWSRYGGLREGTNGSCTEQLLHTEASHGTHYSAAPLKMDMHMHMLEFMYSAAEWLGFMVAPQYVQMDMSELHAEEHHEEGGHDGHGEHHENGLPPGTHSHGTAGWGDTSIAAMVRLFNAHRQTVLLNIV